MYADTIVQARTQLLGLENDFGKGALLAQVTQLERLCELIQLALKRVSDHVDSLDEFYEALVRLRTFLDSARETLRVLEKDADCLHFSREASYEALSVVRTLFRTVSRDLDHLFYWLPTESRRRTGASPLNLTVGNAPIMTTSPSQP